MREDIAFSLIFCYTIPNIVIGGIACYRFLGNPKYLL